MQNEHKSELTLYGEGLRKRLEEFFAKEGFDKTEIILESNGEEGYGGRRVVVRITASTEP